MTHLRVTNQRFACYQLSVSGPIISDRIAKLVCTPIKGEERI